jgi:hypothetical protein
MGKLNHSQRRAAHGARCINLYPANTTLGWRPIRQVTAADAAKNYALGKWGEVHDEHGNFWGYQVLASPKTDQELSSEQSSTSLTARECDLIAGQCFPKGKSHTLGLSEAKKLNRHPKDDPDKFLAPEDAVELAVAKEQEFKKLRLVQPVTLAEKLPNTPGNWDAFPELAHDLKV